MRATKRIRKRLPGRFEDLVQVMPPQAITDEVSYENTTEMIDCLMASGKLTKGQALYLETLVQLTHAYEDREHEIAVDGLNGIDMLRHLLAENAMNASDLARLLGVHTSMGSKVLKGERSLTIEHVRKLSKHFSVSPDVFLV